MSTTGTPANSNPITLPSVLHFLNTEWRRFERDRNEWAIERESLLSRTAQLVGEKRALETANADLLQRLALLEYALKRERNIATEEPPVLSAPPPETISKKTPSIAHARSREILKTYLAEASHLVAKTQSRTHDLQHHDSAASGQLETWKSGFGTMEDDAQQVKVEAKYARAVQNHLSNGGELPAFGHGAQTNGNHSDSDTETADSGKYFERKKEEEIVQTTDLDLIDSVASVTAALKKQTIVDLTGPGYSVVSSEREQGILLPDADPSPSKLWKVKSTLSSHLDAVRTIQFLPNSNQQSQSQKHSKSLLTASEDGTIKLWSLDPLFPSSTTSATGSTRRRPSTMSSSLLDLEPSYTFRGHIGPVTALAVCSDASGFYTGGVDASVRYWNLVDKNGNSLTKRDSYDSYRTHLYPESSCTCVPLMLYSKFVSESNPQKEIIVAHTDVIWEMALNSDVVSGTADATVHLATASADGTVKLFTTDSHSLVRTFVGEAEDAVHDYSGRSRNVPTSLAWMPKDSGRRLAVSYSGGEIIVYDVETGAVVAQMQGDDGGERSQINKIVAHPTLPLLISAHEDRSVRFHDLLSGSCIQSIVAHLEAVTSLSVHRSGTTFASGGHDCSIRWWDVGMRRCVQEYSTHRLKGTGEGIWDVAFSDWGDEEEECFASGGADGSVKMFGMI
ncbi:WD40-repeat-containing domain protein [Chytriomyces cf. hyalinus JEL632]|nr:WD40-repeat-containing domain protein [Chytriomyces cf. hyalinus JEL632]